MTLNPVTYTAADVSTYVKRQFGDESGVQVTDQDIWRWIDSAQVRIVADNQPLKAKATTDVIEGQKDYDLSSLSIHQIESLHYGGEYIEGTSFQEAERKVISGSDTFARTGKPVLWYEWAGQITFWPVPDVTIVNGIEVYYTKMPSKITAATTPLSVPDKFYEAICAWVLSKAYEMDEEFSQAQTQRDIFTSTLAGQMGEELTSENSTYPTITFVGD